MTDNLPHDADGDAVRRLIATGSDLTKEMEIDFAVDAPMSADLYQPLQQGSRDGTQRPTLSLGACSRIVTEHGGRILVRQSPDGYVAFRVELPVAVKSSSPALIASIPTRAVAGSGS